LCYGNEAEVGKGLAKAFSDNICKREDVFITTKLWNTDHRRVEEGLNKSLSNLGLDYVDLYLVHWPVAMNPNGNHPLFPKLEDGSRDMDLDRKHTDTWKDVEKLLPSKVKAIGVCNYSIKFLKELLEVATTTPAVNQVEIHPYLPQEELVQFCKDKGIAVTAYSPLGTTGTPLFKEEDVIKIAEKHHVNPGTVLISFASKSF
jgi:glycerol 2-dehydrogenase (NADP+)